MSSRRRLTLTLLAVVPWAVLLFQFLFVLPRQAKFFAEMGLKLPGWTALVLDVSHWLSSRPLFAVAATLGGVTFSSGLTQLSAAHRVSPRTRTLLLLTAFGVPVVLFGLAWLGVDVVHRRLDEGQSK
jgi:type II secretory pathway component PulF